MGTCCDPVESDDSPKCGVNVAGPGKHGLIQRCQQCAKDDHSGWRQNVGQSSTDTLGGVAEKLSQGLKVANLQQEQRLLSNL